MTTEEPNKSATPSNILVPQDQKTLSKPLPQGLQQYWLTSTQVYHSVSNPTPSFSSYAAGPYFYPHMLANQAYNLSLQHDSLHDLRKLTNHPVVARDFSPIEKQQSDTMFANGKVAQKQIDSIQNHKAVQVAHKQIDIFQNHKAVHGSKDAALQDLDSGTALNASGNILLNEEEENETERQEDEIRKKRMRESNRLSVRRTRVRKKECDDLHEHVDGLKHECSSLRKEIMSISEICHQFSEENNSLQEDLIHLFGKESIADLLDSKNSA
ncbi:hypothetical protein L6164_035589 [Bauhinia variegata]|uniref:Uncharacterized protein n=1 Tax=Bauhinia variegata TaxID=167791 RepID=A0ACB9KEF2_BAUVA|nr:hypothetical protein L6164_035589 [Bauhinia variegata]